MKKSIVSIIAVIAVGLLMAVFIMKTEKGPHGDNEHSGESSEEGMERGPHGGRLLSQDDFQLEITIYEEGVQPQFRVYPFEKGKPFAPDKLKLTVSLHRLGGRVDEIAFRREGDYLQSDKEVEEPHSFDVKVSAEWNEKKYSWEYSQVEGRVELSEDAIRSSGIEVATAGPARIKTVLELPGEIGINRDLVAHVVPRLSGVVREVTKNLGDRVRKGELLAVIDSRELADSKSSYLSAIKRVDLARATFNRTEGLWKMKVTAEKEYLASRQAMAEAEIELQAAARKLISLGIPESGLAAIAESPGDLTRYEIRAPRDGMVLEKHISVGEALGEDTDIFMIADLSTVWVEITVYAKDLGTVRPGQRVVIRSKELGISETGAISYIGPLVGEQTRAAKARVSIPNPAGQWRPGLFVEVEVVQEDVPVKIAVPVDAIQTMGSMQVIFVQYGNLFEARPVDTGRTDGERVEVLSGLVPGERYVSKNSFVLKADIGKAGAAHEH